MVLWSRCPSMIRQEQLLVKPRLSAVHPFLLQSLRVYSKLERFKGSFAQLLVPASPPSCHDKYATP